MAESDPTIEDQHDGASAAAPLTGHAITWNLHNGGASDKAVSAIFDKAKNNDFIVVATQEETRDKNSTLQAKLLEKLGDGYASTKVSYFNTWTGGINGRGRVSLSVIYKTASFDQAPVVREAVEFTNRPEGALFNNKGGVGFHLDVQPKGSQNKHVLRLSSIHLDSFSDANKAFELSGVMQLIERQPGNILSYEQLELLAADATLVAGDFNLRDVIADRGEVKSALTTEEEKHLAAVFRLLNLKNTGTEAKRHQTFDASGSGSDSDTSSNESSPKNRPRRIRRVGSSRVERHETGELDAVRANAVATTISFPRVEVLGYYESDHKVVMRELTLADQSLTNFERTRNWIANEIKEVASDDVVKKIEKLNSPFSHEKNPKEFLVCVANHYLRIRALELKAHRLGLQGHEEACSAVLNISKSLKDEHDVYFLKGSDERQSQRTDFDSKCADHIRTGLTDKKDITTHRNGFMKIFSGLFRFFGYKPNTEQQLCGLEASFQPSLFGGHNNAPSNPAATAASAPTTNSARS